MSYPQILLLGLLNMIAVITAAFLLSAGVKYAVTNGMKEVLILYIAKKKEAIEELEKKFSKAGAEASAGPQRWSA